MHYEPSWHTVINADASVAFVASATFKVIVRPHVRWEGEDPVFEFAFLPRVHVRHSTDFSSAKQALLDSEWTWSHGLWGQSEASGWNKPDWYKPWMGERIREIWRLWQEGDRFVGLTVRYDRGYRTDGTYWEYNGELEEEDE